MERSHDLQVMLRRLVERYLNNLAISQATFYAERLIAEEFSNENVSHLARCYILSHQYKRAISFLSRVEHLSQDNLYLLAQCYFEDHDHHKAISILVSLTPDVEDVSPKEVNNPDFLLMLENEFPGGANGLFLLGKCADEANLKASIIYFKLCLKLDPFYFEAYEYLCELGEEVDIDPTCFFSLQSNETQTYAPVINEDMKLSFGVVDKNSVAVLQMEQTMSALQKQNLIKQRENKGVVFGSFNHRGESKEPDNHGDTSCLLLRMLLLIGALCSNLCQFNLNKCKRILNIFSESDLFNQYNSSYVLSKVGDIFFHSREFELAKKIYDRVNFNDKFKTSILDLYSSTLWSLKEEVALSHLGNFARQLLGKEKGKELKTKFYPELWVVLGNCCSLQKERELSIKFLQRATVVRPKYAYAYSLLAHEFLCGDNVEEALSCFKQSIAINPRQYGSLYGMTSIYVKREEPDRARCYIDEAIRIHGENVMLRTEKAVTLSKQYEHLSQKAMADKENDSLITERTRLLNLAIFELDAALNLDPKHRMAKYLKAKFLLQIMEFNAQYETHANLNIGKNLLLEVDGELKGSASAVLILLSDYLARLGELTKAINSLERALEACPDDHNLIKARREELEKNFLLTQ
eukprot:maker-scaffold_3-snap-gene-1.47-mRNA-1 protein AED:0.00 eAED:0.00 QI:137/1/1/1/1/1/6/77/635